MGGSSGGGARELDQTPTWAVATVCAALIAISIFIEKVIHYFGHVFTRRRQWALYEALEKIKAELMLLGFISLILAIGQGYIEEKCIPLSLANTMLPCHHYQHKEPPNGEHHPPDASNEEHHPPDAPNEEHDPPDAPKEEHHRRLLWNEHRMLSGGGGPSKCKEGTVPLISLNGLHQLHIFIFWLAAFHVVFGAMTMMLGRLQIRGWKDWERETLSHDYDFSSDTSRFRLTKETSFVKSHSNFWTRNPIFFYIDCFFRQFFRSVRKSDYLAMRHGFISVHLAPGSKFNFQKYIKKSLEDDFKVVVGISPLLWASVIVFLLVNVSEWEALTWLAVIPLFVILAVGTKLQAIITQMALEIQERHAVIQGMPVVQVSDSHFWFGWPDLVLYLIHFTLFQNAFQITYFFWIWYEFGLNSCFFENANLLFLRVALGFGVQFMCSYVTLPLYALVTQMGSTMKRSVFDDQTSKALKKWHMNAMKKKDVQSPTTRTLGGSPGSSPPTLGKPLEQIKTTGQSARSSTSDVEQEASELPTYNRDGGGGMARQRNHNGEQEMVNGEKFSNIDLLSGP